MKSFTVSFQVPWHESLTSLSSLCHNEKYMAIVLMPVVLGIVAFLYSRIVGPSVPELHVEIGELEANDKLDVEKYTSAKAKKVKNATSTWNEHATFLSFCDRSKSLN